MNIFTAVALKCGQQTNVKITVSYRWRKFSVNRKYHQFLAWLNESVTQIPLFWIIILPKKKSLLIQIHYIWARYACNCVVWYELKIGSMSTEVLDGSTILASLEAKKDWLRKVQLYLISLVWLSLFSSIHLPDFKVAAILLD